MEKLSFKPWHGQKYEKFNIFITQPNRKRLIGRIMAPNEELALIKARENHPNHETLHIEKRKKSPSA